MSCVHLSGRRHRAACAPASRPQRAPSTTCKEDRHGASACVRFLTSLFAKELVAAKKSAHVPCSGRKERPLGGGSGRPARRAGDAAQRLAPVPPHPLRAPEAAHAAPRAGRRLRQCRVPPAPWRSAGVPGAVRAAMERLPARADGCAHHSLAGDLLCRDAGAGAQPHLARAGESERGAEAAGAQDRGGDREGRAGL
eukprot:scaffold13226_cov57-Phaeocystis_antarctica.AAC.2